MIKKGDRIYYVVQKLFERNDSGTGEKHIILCIYNVKSDSNFY